jgi:hypothetical protein
MQSIHIFIGIGPDLEPAQPNFIDNDDNFKNILDLAGEDFYKFLRDTKDGMYECSIWLHHGELCAGNDDDCPRVRKELFEKLKFVWKNEKEWLDFMAGAQAVDPEAIKCMAEFSRDVSAIVPLADKQALCIRSGKTSEPLFDPLHFGSTYEVIIKYADVEFPQTLADCKGFAHHSEALKLSVGEPIFGIFEPATFDDTGIGGITEPGCCDCARMGGPTNLLDDFQAHRPPSSTTGATRRNID